METSRFIPIDADAQAIHRKVYASYGHEGVTASANAYGNLMQITRYFGETPGNPSGFICADFAERANRSLPYHAVERLEQHNSMSGDPSDGFRLKFKHAEADGSEVPHMSFVHNRWPYFRSATPNGTTSVQHLVSDDTVYQIYTLDLDQKDNTGSPPEISFCVNMRLLDLNFTKNDDGFQSKSSPDERWHQEQSEDENSSEETPDQSSTGDSIRYDAMIGDNAKDDPQDDVGNRWTEVRFGNNEHTFLLSSWSNRRPAGLEHNVGLFISLFVGDHPHHISHISNRNCNVTVKKKVWEEAKDSEKLEITLAYTLKEIPLDLQLTDLAPPVLKEDVLKAKSMLAAPFRILQLHEDLHLNFVLWRNVEHILSVCSIPIQHKGRASDEHPAIALTCGDIASHRISTEASFHAFRILLLALKQIEERCSYETLAKCHCMLRDEFCRDSICTTYWRIWRVCCGHIRWLCNNWAVDMNRCQEKKDVETDRNEAKGANYQFWANGNVISRPTDNTWVSHGPYTNAALQIIKVGAMLDSAGGKDIPELTDAFKSTVTFWLQRLGNTKNGLHVFPRSRNEVPSKFHLVDHALIWWAIKSSERLGLDPKLDFDAREKSKKQLSTSQTFQCNVLQRFTTETSKRGMIATFRSLLETKSLLEVDDTFILHAAECGLFTNANTKSNIATWENTLNYQRYRTGDDESEWQNPLQFALAVILSSQGKQINENSPAHTYAYARSVLLKTSSSNGLLAGHLDSAQEPVTLECKEDHDQYWSTIFQIPFILWKCQPPPQGSTGTRPNGLSDKLLQQTSVMSKDIATVDVPQLSRMLERMIQTLSTNQTASKEDPVKKPTRLFENYKDRGNTAESSDSWLYDEPDFLSFRPKFSEEEITSFVQHDRRGFNEGVIGKEIKRVRDSIASTLPDSRSKSDGHEKDLKPVNIQIQRIDGPQTPTRSNKSSGNSNVEASGSQCQHRIVRILSQIQSHIQGPIEGIIADVGKKGSSKKRVNVASGKQDISGLQPEGLIVCRADELQNHLQSFERTRETSKKRLLQFFRTTPITALICYLASCEKEKGPLASFFDRHNDYQIYFFDKAVSQWNRWWTELHLSFWDLDRKDGCEPQEDGCFPPADEILFPSPQSLFYHSHSSHKMVRRTVTSFRFEGDFLDRYWTCHFIEHNPTGSQEETEGSPFSEDLSEETRIRSLDVRNILRGEGHAWQQRRVLELVMVERTLRNMLHAAETIFQEARTAVQLSLNSGQATVSTYPRTPSLEERLTLLPSDSNHAYLSASKLCHKIQYLLQAIQDNLDENLSVIQSWSDRHKVGETARWSLRDEHKYRSLIHVWEDLNNHQIRELKRCRETIATYNSSLTKRLDDIRSELEIRGADDIRLFTYVTAVFLPVGFATGLFSMSDVPSGVTLACMIGTGVIALLLTAIALVKAKVLEKRVVALFSRKTGEKRKPSATNMPESDQSLRGAPPSHEGDLRDNRFLNFLYHICGYRKPPTDRSLA